MNQELYITSPKSRASAVYVLVIDNAGDSRTVAQAIRGKIKQIITWLETINPTAQFAFIYVNHHYATSQNWPYMQEIDFEFPSSESASKLVEINNHIKTPPDFQGPRALECALKRASQINFGNIHQEKRHLILITSSVACGMDARPDNTCHYNTDWREILKAITCVYNSFELIGTSESQEVVELQKQFIHKPEDLGYCFLDLSKITKDTHPIVVGWLIPFLVARHTNFGITTEFLKHIYSINKGRIQESQLSWLRCVLTSIATFANGTKSEIKAITNQIFSN